METPPRELRKRLQRSQETNRFLEVELAELREFTKLESQFMLLEEGCSKLGEERSKLAAEVDNLTKSHEEFKHTISGKFNEKKKYLVDLVGQGVGADIIRGISSAFDELKNLLDVNGPSGDAAPSRISTSTKENLIGSKTLDMVQNELSKIKMTLKGPRRLSDSSLVVERFRNPKTSTTRRDAISQTEADTCEIPESNQPNLLDLSISTLHGAADQLPEMPILPTESRELELKLAEMREECRRLTVANNNLKLAVDDKSEEIQELMDFLDETRASCTCKPMVRETDDHLNRSDCNDSRRNQSSYLPTILEASFDGSDMNDSSFAPEPNSISGPNLIEHADERESPEITDLQKCNDFLTSELSYCLSEVETKNEQITMLQSLSSSAMPSGLAEACNQELESLDTYMTDVFSNDEIKSDVVWKLENALCLIQKYIDSSLSSPKFDFSSDLTNNSSTRIDESAVNESHAVLADASFPQQLCNAVFNASSNTSSLDASSFQSPENANLSKIMNDVRNLRNCSFTAISNFSHNIFEALSKLARMESILQRLRNNSPADSANCIVYKRILLKDIKEKADKFLGVDDFRENHSFAEMSTSADGTQANRLHASNRRSAARSANDSLHLSFLTEDKLPTTDDSLHSSALTGDNIQASDDVFSIQNDVEKFSSEQSAIHSSIIELSSKLAQLGVVKLETETLNQSALIEPINMKSIALLIEELKERVDNSLQSSFQYDPECTELLAIDVSSLNADSQVKRVLQTSQIVNQNESGEENKENALKSTVRNYNKLIVDSKSRIEELEVAKNNAEMKLSQKLADYRSLADELSQTYADLSNATEKISTLENRAKMEALEREKLDNVLQQTTLELSKVAERNSVIETDLNVVYSEKEALENALKLTSEELKNASKRVVELEKPASAEASGKEASNIELSRISEMLTQANARTTELEATTAADAALKEDLQLALDHISGELSRSVERIRKLELIPDVDKELEARRTELACSSENVQGSLEKIFELEFAAIKIIADKTILQRELEHHAEDIVKATERISELEGIITSETSEKKILETEVERLSGELSLAEKKILELESVSETITSDKEKLQNELLITSHDLSNATEKISELMDELLTSQGEKEAVHNKLIRLSEEMSEVTNRVSALELSVSSLESEKQSVESDLARAYGALSNSEKKIAELELNLVACAKSNNADDLKNELGHISEELSKATEHNAELECQLTASISFSTKLEREVSVLQELIKKTRNEFCQLIKFSSERLDFLMKSNRDLQMQLCMETIRHSNAISELNGKLTFAESEITELESGLCNANAQMLMKQHQIEELEAQMSSNGGLLKRLQDLETLSSDLSSSLELTKDNMKELIKTSAQRIGFLETSCKTVEVELGIALAEKQKLETQLTEISNKLLLETMDREKVATELSDSMIVLKTLQEAMQKSKETRSATDQALAERTAENELLKSKLNDSNLNLLTTRKNFEKLTLDSNQYINELQLSKRQLSMIAAEESNAKNRLMAELKSSETMITQLKEFIESTQSCDPRVSSKNDGSTDPCTPLSRSTRSGCLLDDRSGYSCASLGVEEEDMSSSHATVHFERSVFVSDLPMENTICVDNVDAQGPAYAVDPLSMTMVPEQFITPRRKMLNDDESSDESNFGTPVASKWGNEKSPVDPNELEKTIRLSAAKDQIKAILNDIASLKREMRTLLSHRVPSEVTASLNEISSINRSLHDQLSQKESRISELDDTNAKLRETILTGSLEKESLRDELKKERDAVNVLKLQLKDLEMDNNALIEERDVSQIQVNSLEKAIEEVLRLWYKDELPISEDATHELKSLVREVSNAKNLISDYLNKPQNINFFSEVKSLLGKSETLDRTLAILETEGLKKCKDLKEECNQIMEYTASLHAEIEENIQKIVVAMSNSPLCDPKTDELEFQLNAHKSRIATLEAELNEKILHIENLQGQLKSLTNDSSSLTTTNARLIQDVEDANLVIGDMNRKIEELQAANAALVAETSRLQETIICMTEQLASNELSLHSSDELNRCRERITDLEKPLKEKSGNNYDEKLKVMEGTINSLSTENAKLSEELTQLKSREKDLSDRMEDLVASNNSLSDKIASSLETNLELEDKLSSIEIELADSQKKINELTSASSWAGKSSLEIVNLLSSLLESTAGQPVDLTCNLDNPLDILVHIKKVLCKSNDALNAVFSLLNTNETSGIGALELLYLQLKDSDIRDVYMCKKKFSTEISSLDPELRVEDLVKLSLIELQGKLVSVIMEKEQVLIQNYQADYDSKLASKEHALCQYEDREKYMKGMIEDLTKENENLEKIVSELKSNKSTKDPRSGQDVHNEYSVLNSQQSQYLKDNIESLKDQNSLLELSLKEAVAQHEKLTDELAQILSNLQFLLEDDQNGTAITPLCEIDIKSDLKQVLRDIHQKINTMKTKATEDQVALLELDKRHKELENEHKACGYAASNFQTKCTELSNEIDARVQQISALGAEKAQFETEIKELKKMLTPAGGEDDAKEATIADLNAQLEMSAKYIQELESRGSSIDKIKNVLARKVEDLSKDRDCLKEAFSTLLSEAKADVNKAITYVEMITRQAVDLESLQGEYANDIKNELDSLKKSYDDISQEKRMLEASVTRESNEKMILQDKVKMLEDLIVKPVHNDETCPFKTFKDRCEVLDSEKKELQKLLATESDSIKRLLEKVEILEQRSSTPIHVDESCPHRKLIAENDVCRSEKERLKITLLKANEEKDSLLEKIRVLEGKVSKPFHDDGSCPYKEKMKEYKKDLWIIRTKAEEEKKNFDIMKKNLQEDLAFKSSTIKELENRNEATISDFKQRLASLTVSYNQVTQKLEEANERISFLRDMNSQDKKRFEREIEVCSKEISRLQSVRVFMQSIGVECDRVHEALPELKKKLCDYDNLKTALANAEEKNAELDKECDDMCAEIKMLQAIVGEKCEENEELKKSEDKLRKDMNDVMGKYKSLENQLATKVQLEVQVAKELSLKESQLNDVSRKLADESLARTQLENAYKQLECNMERCNQKINENISQLKNYDNAIVEKTKLIEELKSTNSGKGRLLEELKLAVEAERNKAAGIHGQKLALEEQLSTLQKELATCKSYLGTVPESEAKFHKLSLERDEAVRRYQEIESRMPMVQKKMQDYAQQISTLKDERNALTKNREDAEQNWRAQRLAMVDEINQLEKTITDKNTRIIEMESVMASQNDIVIYQNKISELQSEVERLKTELAQQTSCFVRPQTTPIVVRPSPSSSQPAQRQQMDEEYHKLEKKYTVLKRLAEMRRSKILSYQNLLAQHNIDIPQNEVST